jgi:hypothetical protein
MGRWGDGEIDVRMDVDVLICEIRGFRSGPAGFVDKRFSRSYPFGRIPAPHLPMPVIRF